MRSKKGQFYIIISLLLVVYLMMITMPENKVNEPQHSFRQLYENYMEESSQVINSGIYDGDLNGRFRNFTAAFIGYARTKNPEFRLSYALAHEDTLLLGNNIGETISVNAGNQKFNLSSGDYAVVNSTENITLTIKNRDYPFAFKKETDLKAVFIKSDSKEVIIHVEE
ncbi:hypothetical protein HYU11_03675 [Candidatus Woesearchaeota archaeon]|nr:hypothetical protein [Candidatus Woesearchaeota archaeon]